MTFLYTLRKGNLLNYLLLQQGRRIKGTKKKVNTPLGADLTENPNVSAGIYETPGGIIYLWGSPWMWKPRQAYWTRARAENTASTGWRPPPPPPWAWLTCRNRSAEAASVGEGEKEGLGRG